MTIRAGRTQASSAGESRTCVAPRPWTCDTFAVHGAHTPYAATLLAKNSDRPPQETQPLRWLDRRDGGGRLRLAYVEIDDAPEPIPHLGSSPYSPDRAVRQRGTGGGRRARPRLQTLTRMRYMHTARAGRSAQSPSRGLDAWPDPLARHVQRLGQGCRPGRLAERLAPVVGHTHRLAVADLDNDPRRPRRGAGPPGVSVPRSVTRPQRSAPVLRRPRRSAATAAPRPGPGGR